jgi:hypothetical protein
MRPWNALPQSSPSLPQLIADKIARGVLPSDTSLTLWAGHGSGRPCDACDEPIATTEFEYDLDLASDQILRFHGACASFWQSTTLNER